MADDLIAYARQNQSRSAALETLDHGSQMIERDSQGLDVEGMVRIALVSAELNYVDSRHDEAEAHCDAVLGLISENDELLNAKFQSDASLFARHLLTLMYLGQGRDALANDLTSTFADVDVSASAYDFQSSIIGKRSKRVMAGVYEGIKGLCDHALGARELAEESWDRVVQTLGPALRGWEEDAQLNHVMKNYAMFAHCAGAAEWEGSDPSLANFDFVADKAARDAKPASLEPSVKMWGSELMMRQVQMSAAYAAAQILIKDGKLKEAEERLEALLQEYSEHFPGDGDSRTGLIIMKLGQVYTLSNRWVPRARLG